MHTTAICLFYGYGSHQDLHLLTHVFPTRRSSDLVTLNVTYIGNDVGFDYRSASTHFGYQRKLSPRTTVTIDTQVMAVDYLGRRTGDSVILSPRAGIRQQLSDRLSLVADAGISYVRTQLGNGSHSTLVRSEERRGGQEGVSTCSARWSPDH